MADSISQAMPFASGFSTVDPNFSQWQLSPQDVIEYIEHSLRGEIWDSKEKVWKEKGRRKMNEIGIQAIVGEVNDRVNKIVIMSNLDEDMINGWLWDLGHDLAAEMFSRFYDWEIQYPDLEPIHNMVMILSEAALRRAWLEGERKRLYEQRREVETTVREGGSSQGGFFSFIPGFAKPGGNR
jgi:hypothetical protein